MRAVTQRIVDEIVQTLSSLALSTVKSPIPKAPTTDGAARGTMVLNAAFLVPEDGLENFQRMLSSLDERHGRHGFRFDFTGPWPPYHFVNESGDGA